MVTPGMTGEEHYLAGEAWLARGEETYRNLRGTWVQAQACASLAQAHFAAAAAAPAYGWHRPPTVLPARVDVSPAVCVAGLGPRCGCHQPGCPDR